MCKKTGYRDEIGAKLALARIQNKDNASRLKSEKRYYRCGKCRKYHLTSTEYQRR